MNEELPIRLKKSEVYFYESVAQPVLLVTTKRELAKYFYNIYEISQTEQKIIVIDNTGRDKKPNRTEYYRKFYDNDKAIYTEPVLITDTGFPLTWSKKDLALFLHYLDKYQDLPVYVIPNREDILYLVNP